MLDNMQASFVEPGVIIRSVRSGDYDARLAVYTTAGVKWFNAKGVYKPKAKFAAAVGLFTVAEFTVSGTTITGINVLVAPYTLTQHLPSYYLANAIADSLMRLEFVEQAPQALVAAIKALTDLSATDANHRQVFLDYFTTIYEILGYQMTGKVTIRTLEAAFLANVDYKIPFGDMMY